MTSFLAGYAPLFVVPALSAPVALVYLKCGQRYDMGAVCYVAVGAFAAAASPAINQPTVLTLALSFVAISLASFGLRVLVLAYGTPSDFTLVSLGQLWAVPAFIDYVVKTETGGSGIATEPLRVSPTLFCLGAAAVSVIVATLLRRSKLPDRLVALTEAPVQYRLIFGSPLALAVRLELLTVAISVLAGQALGRIVNDLSAEVFGAEGLWALFAVALLPRRPGIATIFGPVGATAIRLIVKESLPPSLGAASVYAVLAVVLATTIARAPAAHRDALA